MGPFRDRFDALYPGELDSLPVTAYTIDKLDGAVARDQGLTLSEVTSALIGAIARLEREVHGRDRRRVNPTAVTPRAAAPLGHFPPPDDTIDRAFR